MTSTNLNFEQETDSAPGSEPRKIGPVATYIPGEQSGWKVGRAGVRARRSRSFNAEGYVMARIA